MTQDEPVARRARRASRARPPHRVRLRAERDPQGDGRVYRIAFEASDGRGGDLHRLRDRRGARKGSRAAVDSAPPSYDSFGS